MDHHPAAVDVVDFQTNQFLAPQPGRIENQQPDAVQGTGSALDEPFHLFAGKDLGQAKRPPGNRQVVSHPGALERVEKEESQSRKLLADSDGAQLAIGEQMCLILPDMLRT
jgi:hypothetical protein